MAPQGQADPPLFRRNAGDQGQIFLVHVPIGKGAGQGQPGRIGQGHADEAGGVLVQAMDHARSLSALGQENRKGVGQMVDQGRLVYGRGRMHGQVRGFVHNQHVFVDKDDIEVPWNGLQTGQDFLGLQGQALAGDELVRGLAAFPAVDLGPAGADPVLYAGPGQTFRLQDALPKCIQTHAPVPGLNRRRDFFHDSLMAA